MAGKKRGRGKRLYEELRRRIQACGYSNRELAARLCCCPSTISQKLNGHIPWQSWEMHKLMELVGANRDEMYELFPPKGEAVAPIRELRVSDYLEDRNETAVSTPVLEAVVEMVRRLAPDYMTR